MLSKIAKVINSIKIVKAINSIKIAKVIKTGNFVKVATICQNHQHCQIVKIDY